MSSIVMITNVHHNAKGSCVAVASLNNHLHQEMSAVTKNDAVEINFLSRFHDLGTKELIQNIVCLCIF